MSYRQGEYGFNYVTVVGNNYLVEEGHMTMDIDWMIKKELSQAISPAYTKWIIQQMYLNNWL